MTATLSDRDEYRDENEWRVSHGLPIWPFCQWLQERSDERRRFPIDRSPQPSPKAQGGSA